jgi:aminopeptidase-like protein
MALDRLRDESGARDAAAQAIALMAEMYPICRSITGAGVRRTLDLVERIVPLERHEVPTGTPAFDWEVPREWNVRDAYVADADGRRVVDFRAHNLHLVSYSQPVRTTCSLDELQEHLYSLPERPDWIPYRTSYYREHWGFCMRHRDRERLAPGRYDVVVDADLAPGHLTYAECTVPGTGRGEAIVYTHTCHPSLANDNLTGIAVAALLARALGDERPRLTWRFVFGPGTIGSLTWLARNEHRVQEIEAGLVVGSLGDPGPLVYKRSRRGATATDRAAEHVLQASGAAARVVDFEPYGYDERQFCSPGFDLPIGRLTRSPNSAYPEYHTSADDLSLVDPAALAESIRVLAGIVAALDANRVVVNIAGKGEPRLGKRGLYGNIGGNAPAEFERALLWVLSLGDGKHDLLAMAARSALDVRLLARAAAALERAGLVRMQDEVAQEPVARASRPPRVVRSASS